MIKLKESTAQVEESEFIYLRKFKSVQQFLKGAKSLDQVLENIETFSNIAKFMNRGSKNQFETPGQNEIFLSATKKNTMNRSMGEEELKETMVSSPDRISDPILSARLSKKEQQPVGSDLNICCICMDRTIDTVLTCFHAYCNECIQHWR